MNAAAAMHIARGLAAGVLLIVTAAAAGQGDSYTQAIEQWRSERAARLTQPDGWLSLVGLLWLKEGRNRFGAAPDNDLVLELAGAPAHIGVFERSGPAVRFTPAPGVTVTTADDRPFGGGPLASDAHGAPTVLKAGSLRFHVIERGDALGLRVKDPDSPARRGFRGLRYFPIDREWRVAARFVAYPEPKDVPVPTVLGTVENTPSPGYVEFDRGGRTLRLDALAENPAEGLFFAFGDRSNGRDTYGGGRFLYTNGPRDGVVEMDFNKAYNPPCVFSEFATCPLPPPGNRLPVAVRAGEMGYGEH